MRIEAGHVMGRDLDLHFLVFDPTLGVGIVWVDFDTDSQIVENVVTLFPSAF